MTDKPTYEELEKRVRQLEQGQPGGDVQRLLNTTQRLTRAGGWEWDVTNQSMIWTEETYRIHGFAPGEVPIGSPEHVAKSLACYDPEDRGVISRVFARCVSHGEPYDLEFAFTNAKGRRMWIRTTAEPVMDQGRVVRVVGNIIDITERKQTEDQLKWSARRNGLLSDTAARLLEGGNLQHLVEDLCRRVMAFLDCQAFFNFLADPQAGRLRLNAYAGIPAEEASKINWIDYGVAVCGCVARDQTPMVCQDIFNRTDAVTALIKSFGIHAYCCHPMVAQGRLIGTLSFGCKTRSRFEAEQIEVMAAVTNLVAVAMSRIKTEQALRESEEKFRLTFDSSPDSVNINRLRDGLYVDINQGFTDLTGFTRQDAIGKTSVEIQIWHDPADRQRLVKTLTEKGYCDNLEARFRRKDGSLTTALMSARVITLKGEPHIISITRDISQRKQAEVALADSERRWRNILVNTPQIGISLNLQGKIAFANAHFLQLTGWTEADVIGGDWFDLAIPEPIREQVRGVFHSVMGQKDTLGFSTYENEIVTRSGERRSVAWSNVLTKDAHGNIVDVTCLGIDLTERKQAEAQQQRLLLAIEQAGESVVITDATGCIQYANPAFENITGYLKSEAIGQNPRLLKSGRHDKAHYQRLWEAILSGNRWTGRMINKRKDGTLFTSECSITPVKNLQGSIDNFVWIARDITKELEMEKRLVQSQRMEAIGALAGGIAHDFNNILFPIIGLSEMLLEDLPSTSPEHENVAQIFLAAKRASDLVKQILAFSRQGGHEKMPIRMQSVLKEVLQLARSTIPSDIGIDQDIQNDCGLVLADPTQLHQIAMNLITNAFHAVEKTGGRICIGLKQVDLTLDEAAGTALGPGTYARLSVADTGIGIDPAVIGKIFEPYFTTKEQGKGTGLGLSVVFGIVRDYGGDIGVASEQGRGSTFTVYLPILATQTGHIVSPAQAVGQVTGTEKILLVDDEASIVHMLQVALERFGYKVTVRTSSLDALETFRANGAAFDLVITDMAMPNLTGDRLARELMKIRPDIPIVLCTGFSERLDELRARSLGIKAFVMKPVVIGDLANQIRRILDA